MKITTLALALSLSTLSVTTLNASQIQLETGFDKNLAFSDSLILTDLRDTGEKAILVAGGSDGQDGSGSGVFGLDSWWGLLFGNA
ncbi:MAG: hypothetical protein HOM14_16425 [Gammaproteobacteria bacterium]|jgi:hypothetical protein|nr:hypothetical protein [Gammaproteobacteria bacterium]MBT3723223.1 hypothetical protein [Gammaproteobacteria bacterium]MBT4076678.1 hypothetical protein [Gammaproteobacteria bacterium]MBT4195784.1 hypothetical protein [Gammaproteobacteria bacterium]MBT4450157.1 hypothetical protein [Gammaproteobacteria bacterium]